MKFIDRLSTMVKADAHGVMDALEERSLLLKQHLREAELALSAKRVQVETLEEEERAARAEAERVATRAGSLDRDVELALEGGEEPLARFAIRKLLPLREAQRVLEERAEALAATRARLSERLEEQERDLVGLRGRVRAGLATLEERTTAAAPGLDTGDGDGAGTVPDEAVELELLRRRRASGAAQEGL